MVAEVGSAVDGVPVVPICLVPDFQDKLPDPQHQIVVETADFPWSWCEFQVLLEWFFVRFVCQQEGEFRLKLLFHLFFLHLRTSAPVVSYLTAAPTLLDPPDWKRAGVCAGAAVVPAHTAERAAVLLWVVAPLSVCDATHPDTWFPTELTEPSEREKRVELLGVRCARVADGLRLGRYPYYFLEI